MNRGFYTTMAAQFFSSLADNALLIACMAMLATNHDPGWKTPLLKFFFVLSYVLLAPFVGAFADAYPKGRVMFFTNLVKILGCALLFVNVNPLLAYGIVGFGAAAYSPAKYGILTELLPAEKLVAANGWIEALTVSSIIFGTALGGQLIGPDMAGLLAKIHVPVFGGGILSGDLALVVIVATYAVAALINLYIPDTGAEYGKQQHTPYRLIVDFADCCTTLWKDKLGQISLAVTTLFWGAGATLQFIVIEWGKHSLQMPLDKVVVLQVVVVIGAVIGSLAAAVYVPLKRTLTLMPVGVAMGFVVMTMPLVHGATVAFVLLAIIGALSGYFVVPMNALLQHRGYVLLSAGHSIAVQNFFENLSILTMLGLYAVMVGLGLQVNTVIIIFGLFVVGSLILVIRWHALNQKKFDSVALIGEHRH